MKLVVAVNRLSEVTPTQTTAMLIAEAARRSHDVYVVDAGEVGVDDDARLVARGRKVPAVESTTALVSTLMSADDESLALEAGDVVLVRTNPGRDARPWAQATLLEALHLASDRGVLVLNEPSGLMAAKSKLFCLRLPSEIRPRTLVSRSGEALRSFVAQVGDAVLKPLEGTRGQDVFFVQGPEDANLDQIIDVLTRGGHAMAQERLPHPERGDTRVVMLGGEPLTLDGHVAAVQRVPQPGELRSNIHRGAVAQPARITPEIAQVCREAGAVLRAAGIWLAGLDIMAGKVLEVNVFSTGGLRDAEQFAGVDFTAAVMDALEQKARAHLASAEPNM